MPKQGEKLRLVELAEQNARQLLEDRVTALAYAADRADDALFSLQDELDLKVVPRLMVCFDVSHIQGTDTVASAVVFENGEPKRSMYRHMKIRGNGATTTIDPCTRRSSGTSPDASSARRPCPTSP
jgi:excinuclease ABC subunit C